MRKYVILGAVFTALIGAATWTWARCSMMVNYGLARPEFVFSGPSSAEIAAAQAKTRELRRQMTMVRIAQLKSADEQSRMRATEKRRDALEAQFSRAFDLSAEQREEIANNLYERGEASEQLKLIEAAQDYYLFAMQIAPGTDVALRAHEALIRLDKAAGKAAGATRGQEGDQVTLLTQKELSELQQALASGGIDSADTEKVRQLLDQFKDFTDEKRQRLVIDKLRTEPGTAYTDGLLQAIRTSSGGIRDLARQALIERLTSGSEDSLRARLTGKDVEGQLAAIKAAQAKRSSRLVPDLIKLLTASNGEVRQQSRQALKSITQQDFGPEANASAVGNFEAQKRWEKWLKSSTQ